MQMVFDFTKKQEQTDSQTTLWLNLEIPIKSSDGKCLAWTEVKFQSVVTNNVNYGTNHIGRIPSNSV